MYVLGISCYFHDAAAALIRDGELVAAAEEERFTRKKHDYNFPERAIDFCLAQGGIGPADLDYVVFFEKPLLKFDRILVTNFQTAPRSLAVFREAMTTWVLDKLWIKRTIRGKTGLDRDRILFGRHHLSHACSAYLCSPFEEAAVMTVDGVGEVATATTGTAKGNTIEISEELQFPHSLGLLYSAFTAFCGFEVNEGEYKLMGMAPYGQPKYVDKVYKLIRVNSDGSFSLNMDYFCFQRSTSRTYNRRFTDLFGPERDPKDRDKIDPFYADVASSIQKVTEEVLLRIANRLYQQTGLDRLCFAGGVALNSAANGRILREAPFKELYIQPAAGDGGGALGAALYGYHMVLGQPRKFVMSHASWGAQYSLDEVRAFLDGANISFEYFDDDERLFERVVDMLRAKKVVGWFQGRFEYGPRALGHRSILADPRAAEMKDIVNQKIKFREPFRPFAPSVLAEEAHKFFEIDDPARHYPARFMLYVVPVRDAKRDVLPAITHVDGTARLRVGPFVYTLF